MPAVESFIEGDPREVKIPELDNEIAQLGRAVAKASADRGEVTRAASLTLVAYVETPEEGREVGELVGALARQNPCRAIILVAQKDATPDGLRAWISARCNQSSTGACQLGFERIALDARGKAVNDLGNVVLPLTLPGLPVYFWWRSQGFRPPEFLDQVLRLTNYLLVDSSRFSEPAADFAGLADQVEKLSGRVSFLDLNWARITPWRELIAQCFDHPESRSYLEHLTLVRIEFESESPRRAAQGAQALLIAGWLASRLDWQPSGHSALVQNEATRFSFRTAHGNAEIECTARNFEGSGRGVCFSITLEAAADAPATFHLERGCDGRSVVTRADVRGRPEVTRTVRLEVLDEAELVNEELQISSRDRVYEEALSRVVRCLHS